VTTEISLSDPRYNECLSAFYAQCTQRLIDLSSAGHDIVVLCECDPFFYGSLCHLSSGLTGFVPVAGGPGTTTMAKPVQDQCSSRPARWNRSLVLAANSASQPTD